MKLATEKIMLEGINNDIVDFSDVQTIDQLKIKIINNYVVLCRNCASASFCKFHDASEPPCPILEKVVDNYIDMNIKAVDTENSYSLTEFIKSVIYLIRIFNILENWRGIYVDEWFNWYFQTLHPNINSNFGHDLLVSLSKFVKASRVVETERLKKFAILVEGNSENEALPSIFSALGVVGVFKTANFINLKGKDRVQKDKIRENLQKFRDDNISYFLILDSDENVKQYIDDLKREKLIDDDNCLIWDNKFEDNFDEEMLLSILLELDHPIFNSITIEELKKYNSTKHDIAKTIEKLLHEKDIDIDFDYYKVPLAKKLSTIICEEIEQSMRDEHGVHNGKRTPTSKSFPDFVTKIRQITEKIKKIHSDFYVVKK
jgi:hypothetical protein